MISNDQKKLIEESNGIYPIEFKALLRCFNEMKSLLDRAQNREYSLMEDLESSNLTVKNLHQKLATLQSTLAEKDAEILSLRKINVDAGSFIDSLYKKITALKAELAEARDLLTEANSTVRTHAMQTYSKHSAKLADEIDKYLNSHKGSEE